MARLKPDLFKILQDPNVEAVLVKLYKAALRQNTAMIFHFLPKLYQFFGKGIDWKTENVEFYDDKYIPIHPAQGTFLYMQARALKAKNILEFGMSYGISTIYLTKAAKDNGGTLVTTEYLPHKVKEATANIKGAGLLEYVDIRKGDAMETLRQLDDGIDFVLLDGWPDMVYPIFKLIESKLKVGSVIVVDDVDGFQPSMKDYLAYVRNPQNGYISTTIYPKKGMEYTVKVK